MQEAQHPPSSYSFYHAVYVPLQDEVTEDEGLQSLHVYHDKNEALKTIRMYKRGRLKTFKTFAEAQEFSRNGLEAVLPNPLANSVPTIMISLEKTNNFKSLKPQNLIQFRKFIEHGEIECVKKTVWDNPKYLVSSGDTPSILQEGCRYNALHIAVKVTQSSKMCELILNTVGDPEFIRLFDGEMGENRSFVDRAGVLQDLYLNTPDKGLNETPLHFATKFGLKDCVRTLLSYKECLKSPLNKYNQTPAEIICSRKSMDDKKLISEIKSLLEEQYYVPVLRAEDNTLQPTIGEPFSPARPLVLNTDPISPRVEVKAFAGPMTKEQAVEFRKKWKTPPRIFGSGNKSVVSSAGDCNGLRSPNLNLSLRLQDTDKGLERVGRELATEHQVAWKEYWPFLKDFADLRCIEGLDKLEEYLMKQFQKKSKLLPDLEKKFVKLFETTKTNKIRVSDICDQFQSLALNCQTGSSDESDDDSEFITPPSSPVYFSNKESQELSDNDDEMDLADDSIQEELFLEGKTPTKVDFAVFTAIPSNIDVNKYPYTYRWRHEMQLASKNINNCIRSPKSLPFKRKLFIS